MTFSIVAADTAAGDLGIAVASKFPAVGAVVPWARAGAGAVATQASANTSYGPEGISFMASGMGARDALDALLEADDGSEHRQAGFVDANGGAATFTGSECMPWAGGITGEGFACQGNILTGEDVVRELARAFIHAEGLSDRLLAALVAGDAAGGDRRGRQSAALLVVRDGGGYEGRNDRYVDLRVDDHVDPSRSSLACSRCGTTPCSFATIRCSTRRPSSSPNCSVGSRSSAATAARRRASSTRPLARRSRCGRGNPISRDGYARTTCCRRPSFARSAT